MSDSPALPVGVVCDFDGTVTVLDIGDEISRHFGGDAHWQTQKAAFLRHELDTRGIILGIYTSVFASEAEVRKFAAEHAVLRKGFLELLSAAHETGAPFILASGGLRQYVEAVLEAHVPEPLRSHIELRANEGLFGDGPLGVHFPWATRSRVLGCSSCGTCKRVSVADLRARGVQKILGIGDGFADRCLLERSDLAFARKDSYLARWCTEKKVAHTEFEELFDAARAVLDTAKR
ncbi:MAG: haloacid dehalogenase-like hydrolase [Deltaproteobacteria bacterium]|nr:haloacid dehalogenase-like hydrolase [Deltaproteobacteria bacterium]